MKARLSLTLLGLALALAGCTAGQTSQTDIARREEAGQSPLLSPIEREAVLSGRILPGMSEEMVAASWGLPRHVASQPGPHAAETWEYAPRDAAPFGARLTFIGGTLTTVERLSSDGLLGVAGLDASPGAALPGRSDPGLGTRQQR